MEHEHELKAAGVHEPHRLSAASRAVGAGVPIADVLAWIKTYGPGILDVIVKIVEATKKP